ncbi:hypothetical protein [Dendronalium sp. ChiSLP03b]|uniref:hypothetical protein n=1 Tax=Dendronalium sp. ChiSLP03b TaxID=3075381 RepID=UPI002AD686EE|nr:hypothetical protein [Dendronalium sp. ChiSLP03b]
MQFLIWNFQLEQSDLTHPSFVDKTLNTNKPKFGLPGDYYFSEQIFADEQQTGNFRLRII